MLTRTSHRALETIEAVATIPIMLLIMVAVVQFGIAIYYQQTAQNAANYGARMGSVAQDCRSCTALAKANEAIASSGLQGAGVELLAPGGSVGTVLKIRVTARPPDLGLARLVAFFGGSVGPITVSAEATFRAEGW